MPPPLPPPRPRVNTQSEISRAYTNPESISSKKRKRNIFGSVFLRHKSMQKPKTSKTKDFSTKPESPAIELICSHRMSFSSPDLSKADVNHYENEFECDLMMARSSATEFSFRNEHSILNSTISSASEKQQFDDVVNISENILSTFNFSCNDSTVNLVGSNLNGNQMTPNVATIIEDISGYCRMAPIIRNDPVDSPVMAKELPPIVSSKFNKNQQQFPTSLVNTITFRRDYGLEASIQNFENLTISKNSSGNSIKDTTISNPIYKYIESSSPTNESLALDDISIISSEKSKQSINDSLDEKYPSYFPNDVSKPTPKDVRKENGINQLSNATNSPSRTENLYIATPRRGIKSTPPSKPTMNGIDNTPKNGLLTSMMTTPMHQSIPLNISSASPLLYEKFAAVTPVNVAVESSSKKSSDIANSIKRFASLPRFKKIDFSPLKFKINSVLQRQNPDQM